MFNHFKKSSLLFSILMFACQWANSFTPSPGLWWNPNESGRGYGIDVQNGVMIVTIFIYDTAGEPLWFLASGSYDANTSTFDSQLGQYSGGQCFGCVYTSPTGVAVGDFSIVFDTTETATLFFPGGSTPIEHELYGYTSKNDYFFGEWSFATDVAGSVVGQWVVFNSNFTGSDGTLYASGAQDSLANTGALGTFDVGSNSFIIAVEDPDGTTHTYQLQGNDHNMIGAGITEPSGVTPTTLTEAAAGGRILYEVELPASKALVRPNTQSLSSAEAAIQAIKQNLHAH
jgi:hypothetical protein